VGLFTGSSTRKPGSVLSGPFATVQPLSNESRPRQGACLVPKLPFAVAVAGDRVADKGDVELNDVDIRRWY